MKLTKRNDDILVLLKPVTISNTSTINQVFFNNGTREYQRRLKRPTNYKVTRILDRKYPN